MDTEKIVAAILAAALLIREGKTTGEIEPFHAITKYESVLKAFAHRATQR